MTYETYLNIPTLGNLQESFNPFQSFVLFVIGNAEQPQLGLVFICSLGIHHEAGHEWHVDSFSEIMRSLFGKKLRGSLMAPCNLAVVIEICETSG